MLVKYKVQDVPGKGLGLIADEFIPAGTQIWGDDKAEVQIFHSREEFNQFVA